jgi:type II secretory pathway component PulK
VPIEPQLSADSLGRRIHAVQEMLMAVLAADFTIQIYVAIREELHNRFTAKIEFVQRVIISTANFSLKKQP